MPAKKKRTRTAPKSSDAIKYPAGEFTLSIREINESKDGFQWSTFLVQGWREGDAWKRRKFKDKDAALSFIYKKQVELANDYGASHRVVTRLNDDQVKEAEDAIHRLGSRYTLREAVDYFIRHFCEPDFKITMKDARTKFIEGKEREGVRERSRTQLESTLKIFEKSLGKGDPEIGQAVHIHEVTAEDVEKFLRSLRAKGGVEKASRKTWNNYRADLSSFFNWCGDHQRRWIGDNPAARVKKFKKLDRDLPETLTLKEAVALMRHVESYSDGTMVRYFALALFAGLRTGPDGELHKLARHPDREKLIDLKNGVIHITPEISKTGQKRQVMIRPNLRAWLERSAPEILPKNHDRILKTIRAEKKLTHDVLRHSFFSYHVGAFRSVGDAALEGGNSESVIKTHYLNLTTRSQGEAFWRISPKGVRIGKARTTPELRIVA
jgi:site-specific recombinase XerD